jgi:hypothetical protein
MNRTGIRNIEQEEKNDREYIIEQRHGVLREIAALRDLIRAKEQQEQALAKQAGLTTRR